MSYAGMLTQTAVHYRPEHDEVSGQRSRKKLREGVRVRVDRGVLALEALPLGDGNIASGTQIAYLSGSQGDWKDGDQIEVDGKVFEVIATSSVTRNRNVIEASVVEKGIST